MTNSTEEKTTAAPQMPEMPKPRKEHEWLRRFEGEWKCEGECLMDPSNPQRFTGSERDRMLGGFWIVLEGRGDAMDPPFANIITLGYDVRKESYIGTWVDSMTGHMWHYEGTVNDAGNTLTLNTQGPCPVKGNVVQCKEVFEFQDIRHRTLTSFVLGEDGQWNKIMFMKSERVK